jgi:hypothetical protein
MKKALLPIIVVVLLSVFIYSCSSDDDDSAASSVIPTPTAEPEETTTQYTLTVSAGEGGSVSTEGGTYDGGTEVTISVTPNCWYIFVGWSDGNTDDTRTIIIDATKTLKANFEEIEKREIPDFSLSSYYTRTFYEREYNQYIIGDSDPLEAVVVDYNMDGILDLIHTNSDYAASFAGISKRNKIHFYKGLCNGNLELDNTLSNNFNGLEHGRKGLVGDFNKDGFPDIFFIGHGIDVSPYPGEYPILLTNQDGTGFQETRFENLIGFWHGASSGDVDNDGDIDIVLISQGKTYIMKNNNGFFDIIQDDINDDSRSIFEYPKESIVPRLSQVYTSELFDIDRDGFLDLIVSGHDWDGSFGKSYVLFGNGESFLRDIKTLPSVLGYGICVDIDFYDINNDGDIEIILNRTGDPENGAGFYTGWKVQILELTNGEYVDSTDKFMDVSYGSSGNWMNWLHIGDLNNDGLIKLFNDELAVSNNSDKFYRRWELIDGKFILK